MANCMDSEASIGHGVYQNMVAYSDFYFFSFV